MSYSKAPSFGGGLGEAKIFSNFVVRLNLLPIFTVWKKW